MNKVKILFLAANPLDQDRLALDEEIRAISQKLRASKSRDQVEVESAWGVRTDDLLQLLNEHKPHIVHFSGHGSKKGEILLLDAGGGSQSVSNEALKALFTTLKDNIRVIVLNACSSEQQAKALTDVIDCAISMETEITDTAAISFASSFYRALGFGRSVKDAFDQGVVALLLERSHEDHTPRLLVKDGVDPSNLFVLEQQIRPPEIAESGAEVSRSQVTLILEGEIQNFTITERDQLIFTLSRLVQTSPEQIQILRVARGSIVITLELPEDAAQRLLSLFQDHEPSLIELQIRDVQISKTPTKKSKSKSDPSGDNIVRPITKPLRVFMCHSSADKVTVRALTKQLQSIGLDVWLDEERLLPGQDWKREISRALWFSDVVVVCLSQSAITNSGFVQKEIKLALDVAGEKPAGAIFLIPILLEPCQVPDELQSWHYVEMYRENGFEKLVRSFHARSSTPYIRK